MMWSTIWCEKKIGPTGRLEMLWLVQKEIGEAIHFGKHFYMIEY